MAQRVNIEVLNKAAVDVTVQNSNAINVEVPTAPRGLGAPFTADKTEVIIGEIVDFSATNVGLQYYWEIEDISGFVFKNGKDVSHKFENTGEFDVALTQANLSQQKSGIQVKKNFIKVEQGPLLLNQPFATGAKAAYSLRSLKTSATKAVRVREDAGNTETDIGFSNGTLDETALLNHCGSANGFVTKWYDQSGNGNDASNLNNASGQPKIFDSTNGVIKENNKPAIQFDGNDDFINAQITPSNITDNSVFTVSTPTDGNNFHRIFQFDDGSSNQNDRVTIIPDSNGTTRYISKNNDIFGGSDTTTFSLLSAIENNSGATLYKDGSSIGDKNISATQKTKQSDFTIGAFLGGGSGARFLTGTISEIIYYSLDKSTNRNNIETNINNFYSIF